MIGHTLLLSALLLSSAAGDTVRVGDPDLAGVTLPVGTDTVDTYRVVEGERRLVVTYVQTVTRIPEGYLAVQENLGADGQLLTLDSIAMAAGTLATLWHGDVTPEGSRHVSFADGRMTGVIVDSVGEETRMDETMPAGLFDYSVLNFVADRLPLDPGYEAVVATWDITRGAQYPALTVTAAETVTVGGRPYDAWRVDFDFGDFGVTRWVERDTRRELRWSLTRNGTEMLGELRNR